MQDTLARVQEILQVPLFTLAGTVVNGFTLAVALTAILITLISSRILQGVVGRFLTLRGISDSGSVEATKRLVHYLVLVMGLGISLDLLGIDLTALFAAGALFAVAIGFGMQNLSENFISGLILLFERSIKPGDVLEVEGKVVKVVNLGVRSTIVRTMNDESVVVPNSVFIQNTVKNLTLRDRNYRLRSEVGVTYDSDMREVRRVLETTARGIAWRLESHDPVVLLKEFGSSSVDFEVSVWIGDPFEMNRRRSDLNEAIWWALQDAGIVIAFPQLDLHLDPPVMESFGRIARRGMGPDGTPRAIATGDNKGREPGFAPGPAGDSPGTVAPGAQGGDTW